MGLNRSMTIDPESPLAPYEQVRAQFDEQIRGGSLVAGTKLPTVRRLAEDLGLAANTVARAYRELEQSGLIETRGRAGSFVAGAGAEREAREAAVAYVARLTELGRAADAVALVQGLV